jgi:N-acetylglucosaminyldiphosphoundecaprenol N-acetyl-beta-D-mannosaminyltransferase
MNDEMVPGADRGVQNLRRCNILGVGVHAVDLELAVDLLMQCAQLRHRGYVCVTGAHGVIECQRDPELLRIHNRSLLTVPDGMPLVWLGKLQGHRTIGRVYGPDLMREILRRSAPAKGSPTSKALAHFFCGATAQRLAQLVTSVERQFPGVRIAGVYAPPFRALDAEEAAALREMIEGLQPDFLWVGLSTPKQERFMAQMIDQLDATILVGVGAAFDLLAGVRGDAPEWMRRTGLHWLFRLIQEPGRLWRRYLRVVPAFAALSLLQLLGLRKRSMKG